MATPSSFLPSPAGQALGLGNSLSQQLADETEEQRKKRLQLQQQQMALGPAAMTLGLGGYNG
jgi:hypothetical protein